MPEDVLSPWADGAVAGSSCQVFRPAEIGSPLSSSCRPGYFTTTSSVSSVPVLAPVKSSRAGELEGVML
ncbi:hypothetical protein D3C81_2183500 [compost metagenome]